MGMNPMYALGDYFGVETRFNEKKERERKISPLQSGLESMFAGWSDAGAGGVQLLKKGADWIFGTNTADEYNKEYKKMNTYINDGRRGSGRGEGTDVTRFVGETVATAPAMATKGLQGAKLASKAGAKFLGQNAVIGAGAGTLRYADNADERMGNALGGFIGGGIGAGVGEKVVAPTLTKVGKGIGKRVAKRTGRSRVHAEQLVDDQIRKARAEGLNISQATRQGLIDEVEKRGGKLTDPLATARKELLEKYNIEGTQAQISRDPFIWRAEREAGKHNSSLNDVHIENHKQLDDLMQDLINGTGGKRSSAYDKMDETFNTLREVDTQAKDNINQLYDKAKQNMGGDVELNTHRLTQNIEQEMIDEGVDDYLSNSFIKKMLDDFNSNALPYKMAEQKIRAIGKRMSRTTDGNERYALGVLKKHLEKEVQGSIDDIANGVVPMPNGNLASANQEMQMAKNAFKSHIQNVENTPALKGAIDGVAPDKAFDKYVLKGNASDIVRMVDTLKKSPQGQQNIVDLQAEMIEYLAKKAKPDDNAPFSLTKFKNELNKIGDHRLRALLSKQQLDRLRDIEKVADILLREPIGSHVNHSNTASVGAILIKQLMGLVNVGGRLPGGNLLLGTAEGIGNAYKAGAGAKMVHGKPQVQQLSNSLGLSPSMLQKIGLLADGGRIGATSIGANLGIEQ